MKLFYKLCLLMLSFACLSAFGPCDQMKKNGEKTGMVVVNVLDKEYYDRCKVKGSINVPMEDLEKYAQDNWTKDTHIVVYCANYMCTASSEGARMLKKLGFEHVWAYEGGTAEMKHMYPEYVVGVCTDAYLDQYKKPEAAEGQAEEAADIEIISTDDLIKKMKEFKLL